jgi:putative hemolysin
MSVAFLSILLIVLLFLSGFFSTSETALFSLSSSKRATFQRSPNKGEKAASRLLSNPKSLLVTILIMNIAVNLGVQNVISSIYGTLSGVFLTVILPFVLTLVFGEILPKTIAVTKNEAISSKVAPILFVLNWILSPIRFIFLKITHFLSSFFFLFLKKDGEVTQEELKHALVSSKDAGLMTKEEVKLLLGSLKLSDVIVNEEKCPRQNIYYHDINDSPQKLRDLIAQKRVSKVPIVDRDLDNVIGVVKASNFFSANHRMLEPKDIEKVMDKPFFIPESMLTRTLLAHFDKNKQEMAILVDEYGGTSGIITREDLVEIVVGQIQDSRDEKTLFTKQGEDVIICSGKYELTDLEQLFDIEIERKGQETTVGGYLLEVLGDIPKSGYKVESNHLIFHVLLATETKVSRVYVKNLNKRKSNE